MKAILIGLSGIGAVLGLAGAALLGYFTFAGAGEIEAHRRLPQTDLAQGRVRVFIANGTEHTQVFEAEGREVCDIPPYVVRAVDIPAGKRRVCLRGADGSELRRARWFPSKSSWVLNPEGRVRFGVLEVTYVAYVMESRGGSRIVSEIGDREWFRVQTDYDLGRHFPDQIYVTGEPGSKELKSSKRTKLVVLPSADAPAMERFGRLLYISPITFDDLRAFSEADAADAGPWIEGLGLRERAAYLDGLRAQDIGQMCHDPSARGVLKAVHDLLYRGVEEPALDPRRAEWARWIPQD